MPGYPQPKFSFSVEWGGNRLGFTEVTGLDRQLDIIEYREGNSPEYHKTKMPGMEKFSNVVMKRGTFKSDNELFMWLNTVQLNKIQRRDLIISLLDESHTPVVTWKIKNAWPINVKSTDLKSDGNEVAIESVEIAHEGLVIQND